MAERSRQRVRGVRLRRLGQAQLRLHHRGHLLLQAMRKTDAEILEDVYLALTSEEAEAGAA